MASRFPLGLLAAVLMLGTFGAGRAFFMLVFGWLAFQAGAHDIQGYMRFLAHLALGLVVLGIAISLVRRARWAWIAAISACLAMLVEGLWRIVSSAPIRSGSLLENTASIAYVVALLLVIALLATKGSREYLGIKGLSDKAI
jgi:hypothetical protein